MSGFQSGRPETSAPGDIPSTQESVSSPQATPTRDSKGDGDDDGLYVPHVFDFIDLAKHAARYTSSSVPALYLEPQAVDTSTLIGHGASFTASRHFIPKANSIESTAGGDLATQSQKSSLDCVVYKTARVAFTPTGEAISRTDRKAMSSVLMELFALVHPPLLQHPNIVTFLGLAWGSNPFEPTHRLPIVVVEYANHGTLADLQQKVSLPSALCQSLCLDVALGLDILHHCGIVHGDVKSENILIFSHPERQYIAKVADFGFSVVAAAADLLFNVGGTRPWKAPETNNPVPREQSKLTDVYSFGLLVWRVATDGKSPFGFIVSGSLQEEEHFAEIERMKRDDELKARSQLRSWYPVYVKERSGFRSSSLTTWTETIQNLQKYASDPSLATAAPDELDMLLSQGMSAMLSLGSPTDLIEKVFLQKAQMDSFYRRLDEILGLCLVKEPELRDLPRAISLLQGTVERTLKYSDFFKGIFSG